MDKEEKKNCSDEKVLSWEGQRYVIALKRNWMKYFYLLQTYNSHMLHLTFQAQLYKERKKTLLF